MILDRNLRELVVEVRWSNNQRMMIKLVIGRLTLNIISAYAPHVGSNEKVKERFWQKLDEVVRDIPNTRSYS